MRKSLKEFTGMYQIQRTLQFQLKPVGKTDEFILQRGLISADEDRAQKYKKVKKIIDRRHKKFIDDVLASFCFEGKVLTEYVDLYSKKDKTADELKNFGKIQTEMRKQISKKFKSHPDYKLLSGKELIQSNLESILQDDAERALIHEFDQWTSYFKGFCENRENMYSDENKSSAIGFRIVEQNFPKYLDNIRVYKKCVEVAGPELFAGVDVLLLQRNNVGSPEELFSPEHFHLTLTQKSIDAYNDLLGGYTPEKGVKIKGLNEFINLYNQKTQMRLPLFSPLFKQILSDRSQELSFLPDSFEHDQEVLESIAKMWLQIEEKVCRRIPELLSSIQTYDRQGIFIANDTGLTQMMQQLYGSWDTLKNAWMDDYEKLNPRGKKQSEEKYREKAEKEFKRHESFSIAELENLLQNKVTDDTVSVSAYFSACSVPDGNGGKVGLLKKVNDAGMAVQNLLNTTYPPEKKLIRDKDSVAGLKSFLDALKDIQRFMKLLSGTGKEPEKDSAFYAEYNSIMESLEPITPLYNKVRNYLCQKPYSLEKFKLNFDSVTFLDGWDENKEKANLGVLFRKDGLFYLGIMAKGAKTDFRDTPVSSDNNVYEKIVYKLLPGPNKMLPKVFFSEGRIEEFCPPQNVKSAYIRHKETKDPYTEQETRDLIRFYRNSIEKHEDWKNFHFNFSQNDSDLDLFYREIELQGYKINFSPVPASYIDSLVEKGDLYLFQIWCKDFSEHSKGTSNMHTLYWKMLFDPRNLADTVYKLNGEAEVFYRKSSIPAETRTIHPANQPIERRRDGKKCSHFVYDLIKDRRFTYDQYSLHTSIIINFKAGKIGKAAEFNLDVVKYLKETQNTHIIGIDRGERNLLYITVMDSNGKIVEQRSLNEITSAGSESTLKTDYHALLDKREKEKDEAQKSWQSIEQIKDLKAGYLSQIIHELAQLVIKYDAIICLEDLNSKFMRGRQKVDKSVYQQFEQKLIKKLQYLVDKKAAPDAPLGVLHGVQLANGDLSLKGKQNGIIFYIPAWCTSKIDPVTGFVNLFDSRTMRWENIIQTRTFFSKFDAIRYNAEEDLFEFDFDYSKFGGNAEGTRTRWTVCTFGNRILSFRNPEKQNRWDEKEINLTAEFKELFRNCGIDLEKSLPDQIAVQPDEQKFWRTLLNLFKLTLQLRNSRSNSTNREDDYILSPVRSKDGSFFDSRKSDGTLPLDADANGAYNIARKGLWVLQQIRNAENMEKVNLAMTKKDWLNFVQNF